MYLYLIVYEEIDGEADWLHVVASSMDQDRAEGLAYGHYKDLHGIEEDADVFEDSIGNVWYNRIEQVGNHAIKLEKIC